MTEPASTPNLKTAGDIANSVAWASSVVRAALDVIGLASNNGDGDIMVNTATVVELALAKVLDDLDKAETNLRQISRANAS